MADTVRQTNTGVGACRAGLACVLAVVAFVVFSEPSQAQEHSDHARRVVVLGIDGMDYGLTRSMIASGDLPALATLAHSGTFLPLQTTMPPLSPVAWSTFMTGTNPGEHGVFDFLCRNPALPGERMMPLDAVTIMEGKDDPRHIPLTGYTWSPNRQTTLRRNGVAIQDVLAEAGVPAVVYKMPANFPVPPSRAGVLAGMGTPDIEGTYGMFTYLTEATEDLAKQVSGGRVIAVEIRSGQVWRKGDEGARNLILQGPAKPLSSATTAPERVTVAFEAWLDRAENTAVIILPGRQVVLRRGEWSDWQDVEFPIVPGLKSIHGLVRFYLKETSPHLRLYVSPVNLAPGTSGLATGGLDVLLAESLGPYSTKGMPEETKAYTQGIFDTDEYLTQSGSVLNESQRAFDLLLGRYDRGMLFLYVSSLDLGCHVLWKCHDPQHPAHSATGDAQHAQALRALYRQMDATVARVTAKLGPDDILYVISDHGFRPMYWEFSLNDWLCQEGYLVLREPTSIRKGKTFADVDWKRTRAYALGFQGLYLNLQGREATGIVTPAQRAGLANEVRSKLLAIRDTARPSGVFHAIYRSSDIYHGDRVSDSPDLIVGYESGYGPTDASVLGELTGTVLADHMCGFSGQHVTDYQLVPGVLFSDRALADQPARLMDMTSTILHDLGVAAPASMAGKVLAARQRR